MISSESLVCMDLAHAIFVRKTHFCRLNLTTQISIFCILYRNCTQTSDEGEGSALISHFWFFSLFQNWGDKSISSAEYCIFAAFLPLDRIRKCGLIFSMHYCERRHCMSSAPCVVIRYIAIAGLGDSCDRGLVMEWQQQQRRLSANYWWSHHQWFCSGRWLRSLDIMFQKPSQDPLIRSFYTLYLDQQWAFKHFDIGLDFDFIIVYCYNT